MKKDWEIYRDTGILGGYIPEQAKLRRTENGEVATVFRDTVTHEEEDCIAKQREMLIGGRRFCITSVFPAEPCATPTDKLIACIDAELEKEAHSAENSRRLVAAAAVYLPYRTGLPHGKGGYNGKSEAIIYDSLRATQSGG